MFEVELKFAGPMAASPEAQAAWSESVIAQLCALGAEQGTQEQQRDTYFRHPSRDFAVTDEAFRLRSVGIAGETLQNRVTYKGPVVDPLAKTRREIELAIEPGFACAVQFAEMLHLLGFVPVRIVEKRRSNSTLHWEGHPVAVAVDVVPGLGIFLELEEQADENGLVLARERLWRLAHHLNFHSLERRSYLEMLLEQDASS